MPIFELEHDGKSYEIDAPDMQSAVSALGGKRPAPPFYGADDKPLNEAQVSEMMNRQPPPEKPLGEKVQGMLANPSGAFSEEFARVGAKYGMNPAMAARLGRDIPQIPAALGPLGAEFAPLTTMPAATAKLPQQFPKTGPKTTTQRRVESQLNYMRAEQSGLSVTPGSYDDLVSGLTHKVSVDGIDPQLHPDSFAVMSRLIANVDKGGKADPMSGGPGGQFTGTTPRAPSKEMSLQELDTLRKLAGDAKMSLKPADRRYGSIITDRLDDYLDTIKPSDLGIKSGPNAREGVEALKKARAQWADMRRSETIDQILEKADIRAGNLNSGTLDGLRTEFRQLAMRIVKDKREANRWSPTQRRMIKQLGSAGSWVTFFRGIGRLSPRSYFSMGGGILQGAVFSPLLTGAMWGTGEASRAIGLGMTKRRINALRGTLED